MLHGTRVPVPWAGPVDVHAAILAGRSDWRPDPATVGGLATRMRARLRSHRTDVVEALVEGGLTPQEAWAQFDAADRLIAACAKAARGQNGASWWSRDVPARRRRLVVASAVQEARPLVSLVEGALPALLCGHGVITHLTRATASTAAHLARAGLLAGLLPHQWQFILSLDPAGAFRTEALLAEHCDMRAPQCCGPGDPLGPVRGMLAIRHDASLRTAVRVALDACFTGGGLWCSATPLIAVHQDHWDAFTAAFARETRRLAPASLSSERAEYLTAWARKALTSGARPLRARS
ncbi:hypothetical protein AB0K93_27055, partial [Streptomyces sp. NPDC052676]